MSNDSNFVLSWDQHEENRTSTLKSLWENEDFLDVTIACDDDQIDAHKVILSAASPFFQKILKRNPHSHPLIYLRGTTKKEVESLLNFIYSGETQVLQEGLEDFMALANSLEVKGLVWEQLEKKKEKPDGEPLFSSEKRKANSRKKQPTRKKENLITEDIQIVEKSEEICEIEIKSDTDISKLMEKYGERSYDSMQYPNNISLTEYGDTGNETDISDIEVEKYGSVENIDQNTSNASMTEYDERISELITKTENVWGCSQCSYTAKNKGHVKEHVEKHIEGYSHECNSCDKTFRMKKSLRQHVYKCSPNNK